MRLRWRIDKSEYVEAYEHRVFDGFVTTAPHVHHKNGIKDDNRPENLEPTTSAHHGRHHRRVDRAEAVRLYEAGYSTPAVGRILGADASVIYRILVAEGVTPRSLSESQRIRLDNDVVRYLHEAGMRARQIAKALGVSATPVEKAIADLGLPPHRPGRPTNDERQKAEKALQEVERLSGLV